MTVRNMLRMGAGAAVAAGLLLASAGAGNAAAPRTLGPGDVIEITTVGEPDLTGEFTLGNDGSVNLPMLGAIQLAGQSLTEATATLTTAVAAVHRNPVVSVKLKKGRAGTVSVLGEVRQPGQVTLPLPATVIEAIAAAGGFGEAADRSQVTWVHEGATGTLDLTAAAAGGGEIADRDVLIVPKRALGVVTIAGAVAKEGIYQLDPAQPLRLSQALVTAGGATPLAKLDEVVLTHADGTRQTVNLEVGPEGVGPDGGIALRDGDILYVPQRLRRENAVYVFGAATVQGMFDFREGITLLELLGAAQPMPYAKLGEITVHRKGADGKAIKIAAGETVRGKAPDVVLERNDLVIIPGAPPGVPKRGSLDLLVPLLYLLL